MPRRFSADEQYSGNKHFLLPVCVRQATADGRVDGWVSASHMHEVVLPCVMQHQCRL